MERIGIRQIQRMGMPARSKSSLVAENLPTPTSDWGYVKGGNLAAGLAAGLKGYLGMRGALEDSRNQQAYNDYLAQLAEQERQDKLEQQGWDRDYKERALAQDLEKAQLGLNTTKEERAMAREQALADRESQYEHERALYDIKRADALADREAQLQAAMEAEKRKQEYDQALLAQKTEEARKAEMLKDLDTVAQKRLSAEDYALWRQNPDAFDITGDGWFKRKLGIRANIERKSQPIQINGFTIVEE